MLLNRWKVKAGEGTAPDWHSINTQELGLCKKTELAVKVRRAGCLQRQPS